MASLKRLAALGGGVQADPQFNLTTLLLHGDGTNGAQNNTFIDSSSNNFTITRAGNATQGTFTPFSQTGWSNNFGGTSGLQTPASSITSIIGTNRLTTSSVFTAEAWIYLTQYSTAEAPIFGDMTPAAGTKFFALLVNPTGKLEFSWYLAPNTYRATGNTTIPINTWTNVAVTISGTTIYLFVNGVLQTLTGTTTNSGSSGGTGFIGIGEWNGGASNLGLFGYISNLRIIKSAFYTSSYTPSIVPLTAVTGTGLLTCQSNRFIDKSSNGYTLTASGTPSVQAFSPFAPTSAYSTSVVGGSGYFDGTGDYLSLADNASLRLNTSAFTIQAWIYRSVTGVAHSIIAKGAATTGYVLQITSTNVLRFTHSSTNVDTTTTIPAGTWTHVAAVRTGTGTNGFQLYINGVSAATATVATDLNQTNTLYVGADRLAATAMNGYISGIRYVVGTAESISVPTAPPSTSSAALCLLFTNAGIIDNTSKNALETAGNAQINTSVKKFGTGSLLFDGVGDYLKIPSSPITSLGSGSWTIEFWLYRIGSGNQILYDQRNTGTQVAATIYNNTANTLAFFVNGANRIIDTTTFPSATWTHVAVCKSGSSTRMFVNGTQVGSTYTDTNTYVNNPIFIGAEYTTSSSLNGYIDDLRVSLFARYTANFTAPTAAFADQ